jgi:hydroxyacylglutathione hydrolase
MNLNNQTFVNRIVNPHFDSNTYLIYRNDNDSVIIIDPGNMDSKLLIELFPKQKINNYNVILTHEHYDHIAGLKSLCSLFEINVFLSNSCLDNLCNPKKNLTDYLDVDIINTLPIKNFNIVQDKETVNICGFVFKFYYTPGHSEGSICFGLDNKIFTGDTLMKNQKIITNLPGGNKLNYEKTLGELDDILKDYKMIYPGHGSVYYI